MEDFILQNKAIRIIANRNSGKSVRTEYLLKYAISQNQFNKVYVICPINDIKHFYDDIVNQNNIMSTYSEEWLTSVIEKLSKINGAKVCNV